MVEVRNFRTPEPVQQTGPRDKRRLRRLQVLKDARQGHENVRVVPGDEKYRPVLRHPLTGVGFRAQGSASWPDDRFTRRRLMDGSVKLEAKEEPKNESAPLPESKPSSRSETKPA